METSLVGLYYLEAHFFCLVVVDDQSESVVVQFGHLGEILALAHYIFQGRAYNFAKFTPECLASEQIFLVGVLFNKLLPDIVHLIIAFVEGKQ